MELKFDQSGAHKRITLDGLDITEAVRKIEITADAWGHMTNVTLDLGVDPIEVTALAEPDVTILVNITPEAQEALQALGWVKSDRHTYVIPREDL